VTAAGCGRRPPYGSVEIHLDQPLVRDAEVVRDLVQDDAADLTAQPLRVFPVPPLERPRKIVILSGNAPRSTCRVASTARPSERPRSRSPAGGHSSTTISTFDIAPRKSPRHRIEGRSHLAAKVHVLSSNPRELAAKLDEIGLAPQWRALRRVLAVVSRKGRRARGSSRRVPARGRGHGTLR